MFDACVFVSSVIANATCDPALANQTCDATAICTILNGKATCFCDQTGYILVDNRTCQGKTAIIFPTFPTKSITH